jgi:predicted nucleotidyltransferase
MTDSAMLIKEYVAEVVRDNPKVKRAYLFGSFARGENTEQSDVDISLDTENGFTLIDAGGIRQQLVAKLNRNVDLVAMPTQGNKGIFDSFEHDKVLLYER